MEDEQDRSTEESSDANKNENPAEEANADSELVGPESGQMLNGVSPGDVEQDALVEAEAEQQVEAEDATSEQIDQVENEREDADEEVADVAEDSQEQKEVDADAPEAEAEATANIEQVVEADLGEAAIENGNGEAPEVSVQEDTPEDLQDRPNESLEEAEETMAVSGVPTTEVSEQVVRTEPTLVEAEEEELLHRIPEDFYYDYNELVTKPFISENSDIPQSLLTLQ